MTFHRLLAPLGASALLFLSMSQPTHAALVTYSYSGAPLNTNEDGNGPPDAPFTGFGSIFGEFTIDCTGIGNGDCAGLAFGEYGIHVTDYSFYVSDIGAPMSLTFANKISAPSFFLQTAANADLTAWSIVLSTTVPDDCTNNATFCSMVIDGASGLSLPPFDNANLVIGQDFLSAYSLQSGTFATVPLPIALVMLLGAIGSLAPFIRRASV